jgi:DNA-binding transcriptional regulator YiaG
VGDRGFARSGRFLVTNPELLRLLRKGRGLTVAQLAAAVGVTTVTVRNWESGTHGNQRGIYAQHAVRLLRVLRQDPDHAEHLGTFTQR